MSTAAMGWGLPLDVGDTNAHFVLITLCDHAQDPAASQAWASGPLFKARKFVYSPYGVAMPSVSTIAKRTHLSENAVRLCVKMLHAVGLIFPANPLVPLAMVDGRANLAPAGNEMNAAIDSRLPNEWLPVAVKEAKKILGGGLAKSRYNSLREAMEDLCPLAALGFAWVDTIDDYGNEGGHWVPVDEAGAPELVRLPPHRRLLRAVSIPEDWAPGEQDDDGTEPTASDDAAAQTPVTVQGETTPEGLATLGSEPADAAERTIWRRENYRLEQTQERPRPEGTKAKNGRKMRTSEAAWLIADRRFQDFEKPPVGRDGGAKFMVRHQDAAQAMLNEGYAPKQILDALRSINMSLPSDEVLRGELSGTRRRRGGLSAVEGIAAAAEGAATAYEQTDENRQRQLAILAAFDDETPQAQAGK